MTAFEQAFALLKMPFVPGSVRAKEGEFMEGDDDHTVMPISHIKSHWTFHRICYPITTRGNNL